MTLWYPDPPQGLSSEQELIIIGRSTISRFGSPQGMAFAVPEIIEGWFDTNWLQRIPLTVNPNQVPSIQTDFATLIFSTFPSLIGFSEAELRFAAPDMIQLEYEIQKFDTLTGELIAWVKKPALDNDDIIFIYYDNPLAVDEQDSTAVWDVNYKARYSMKDDSLLDSTINAQDLTHFGSVDIVGKIGNAQSYNSTVTSYAIRNPFTGFPSTEICLEYWAKTSGVGDGMFSYAVIANTNEFLLIKQEDLEVTFASDTSFTGLDFNDNVFHHIVIQWRSSDGMLFVYVDAVLLFTRLVSTGHVFTDGGSLVLSQDQDTVGGGFSGAQAYGGILDEVRLSDKVRSGDYVTTAFNNQNDNGLFFSIGTVQVLIPSFVQTGTTSALVQTGTLSALVQNGGV